MVITGSDLRRRWSDGRPCHGVWSLLPGSVTGEVLGRTGADYVVVDLQHGALAEAELPGVAAAITAAGSVPLVRTRSPDFADVGRPLDLGAHGVIVPSLRDADHVREVVAACRYAPTGTRSIGRLSGGADEPLVIAMVETASALDDLDAVLAVEGLDGVYVGPGDLGLSLGLTGEDRRRELREVLGSIIVRAVAARRAGRRPRVQRRGGCRLRRRGSHDRHGRRRRPFPGERRDASAGCGARPVLRTGLLPVRRLVATPDHAQARAGADALALVRHRRKARYAPHPVLRHVQRAGDVHGEPVADEAPASALRHAPDRLRGDHRARLLCCFLGRARELPQAAAHQFLQLMSEHRRRLTPGRRGSRSTRAAVAAR